MSDERRDPVSDTACETSRDCHAGRDGRSCAACRHFCGFRRVEVDFDTGDAIETVQCSAQVFATPDMAANCRRYRPRETHADSANTKDTT